MMNEQFFYCSELSRGYREKTYGTASVGDVWILIEYAGFWGPKALQDSDFSQILKVHLNRTVKSIPRARLLFIKRDPRPRGRLTVFVVRCREHEPSITRLKITSHNQLLDIDLAAIAAGAEGATDVDAMNTAQPLYLAC